MKFNKNRTLWVVIEVPIETKHILQIDQIEADKKKKKDEYHDAI